MQETRVSYIAENETDFSLLNKAVVNVEMGKPQVSGDGLELEVLVLNHNCR